MNKALALCLCASMATGVSASPTKPSNPDIQTYIKNVQQHKNRGTGEWMKQDASDFGVSPTHIVTAPDATDAPCSYWGSVYTPDGEEWMYAADFSYAETPTGSECISKADFTIYDAKFNVYGKFTANFELGEHETGINSVQMNPYLSRKFFNINDAYEVMVMVHATTEDYVGHIYTQVYTLSDGSLVDTIEGNNIDVINTSTNTWSEDFTMVFMREDMKFTEDGGMEYNIMFDIYGKAGWGTGCQLKHVFDVDYELVAGAGNYAMPILVNSWKGKLYYALPRYEKPYFEDVWSEEATPDNNFIIDLYDQAFNLVRTTTIPIEVEGDAMFSFPGLGELYGNKDLSFGLFSDSDEPMYIIGVENYQPSSDDFTTSFYVYDTAGNKVKTIGRDVADYMMLSDIPGQPDQFCFYYPAADLGFFSMVNLPQCVEQAYIPLRLGESEESPNITTSIDRVASGNSCKYVSSLAVADTNDAGDALHRFAWFNADGSFDRFDTVNLGQNIALAQPNVSAQALNPYLFNTDSSVEYMFLVKEYSNPQFSTSTDEKLRIYGADNELLLEMGPRKETGEILNSIFIINDQTTNPKLIVSYYSYTTQKYTITRVNLPLTKFNGGGTAADPYQLSTPGDLMAMHLYPSSYFVMVNDIDFGDMPWEGTKSSFYGTLDGAGYTITGLNLTSGGIFDTMYASATVKNLNIKGAHIKAEDTSGLIANNSVGEGTKGPQISNVHVSGLDVEGNASLFGGLVGFAAGRSNISLCSVQADIDLPRAVVGGIIGRLSTGSEVNVSYFKGKINGGEAAGGICGESFNGDETIANCHVMAEICADFAAGGIIGASQRTIVHNCLAEGSVNADGSRKAYAGGIVGSLDSTYEPVETPIVYDNISAAEVSANESAEQHIAHRIAGFTSGDEMLVNWDSKDPSVDWSDPSTYPYYKGEPEQGLAGNFALTTLIDAETADAADTPEGQSITEAELTASFYESHGWKIGESYDSPWKLAKKLVELYFESDHSGVADIDIVRPEITVERGMIKAHGEIVIYNTGGAEVLRGIDQVCTERLSRGVYVASCASGSVKFMVR